MSLQKSLLRISVFGAMAIGPAFGGPVSGKGSEPGPAAPTVAPAAYNEAPIVSGRSVSARHKSKMHHVRARPDQPGEGLLADEGPAAGQ
jgi:hypothetical protein